MMSKKSIENKEDVSLLVHTFYDKALKNQDLKPFFTKLDFKEHLSNMIHFWSFVLIDEPGYTTNVTDKHISLTLKQEHFDSWLGLFNETVDELFEGDKATVAKQRAFTIAWTISNKIKNQ